MTAEPRIQGKVVPIMFKKLLAVLLAASMLIAGLAFAEEAEAVEHAPVVILYANDIHCGIEDNVGYAGVAAYRKAYEALGYETLLVDNGDAIQGDVVGTLSKGEAIIDIMNALDYDLAIPGNHEFDYGMEQFMALTSRANFPYISSNFKSTGGEFIFDTYKIVEIGGWKLGFVAATTPDTFTSSTPTYFQNEQGEYIYSFCEGGDGAELYAAVQDAVDAARAAGAEKVILLSHLGVNVDGPELPFTSSSVITHTTGIDAVLDGHSHTVMECELVKNADGEDVILTQTGTKLQNLGTLFINPEDGTLSTQLHNETIFKDAEAQGVIDEIKAQNEEILNEVVASTQVKLTTTDPTATAEDGSPLRIVRSQETNLGDLCADAYRVLLDADIGFVNGGGVRADIDAGDITYADIIKVHPFGNMACKIEVTGQQVLDALEMGASALPAENGGFIQVSGLTYEIDVSVPSSVVTDDKGNFVEVSGDRRVKNVTVGGEPIDPEKTYTLASHNYWLKSGGDGMSMFPGSPVVLDEVLIDNQVLINYIVDELGGVVGEEYADPYGQGRIVIKE